MKKCSKILMITLLLLCTVAFSKVDPEDLRRNSAYYYDLHGQFQSNLCHGAECFSFLNIISLHNDVMPVVSKLLKGFKKKQVKLQSDVEQMMFLFPQYNGAPYSVDKEKQQLLRKYVDTINDKIAYMTEFRSKCDLLLSNLTCDIAPPPILQQELKNYFLFCSKNKDCTFHATNGPQLGKMFSKTSRRFLYRLKFFKNFDSEIIEQLHRAVQHSSLQSIDFETFNSCMTKLGSALVDKGIKLRNTSNCKKGLGPYKLSSQVQQKVIKLVKLAKQTRKFSLKQKKVFDKNACYSPNVEHCFLRAFCLFEIFKENGISNLSYIYLKDINRIADSSKPPPEVFTNISAKGISGSWGYHIALSFTVDNQLYIVDPLFLNQPMSFDQWAKNFNNENQLGAIVGDFNFTSDILKEDITSFNKKWQGLIHCK